MGRLGFVNRANFGILIYDQGKLVKIGRIEWCQKKSFHLLCKENERVAVEIRVKLVVS